MKLEKSQVVNHHGNNKFTQILSIDAKIDGWRWDKKQGFTWSQGVSPQVIIN